MLDLVNAIRVSADDFFYNLGALTERRPDDASERRRAAAVGASVRDRAPTGIDLGGEVAGTCRRRAWRSHVNKLEAECDNATGPFKGKRQARRRGGAGSPTAPTARGRSATTMNLAVGQGDVQVTPLQLAVAYSAIANGGTVVRPHLGLDVQAPDGTVLQQIDPPPARHININPLYLDTIRQGCTTPPQTPGGTSDDVMGNFPEQVYGKTGTAQYIPMGASPTTSWYVVLRAVVGDQQADRGRGVRSSRADSATSARPRSRARSCRSGSSASAGSYVAGSSRTL